MTQLYMQLIHTALNEVEIKGKSVEILSESWWNGDFVGVAFLYEIS
jgi:hypothetical protein